MIGRPTLEIRALVFVVAVAAAGQAVAEDYPMKPVRIVTGASGIFHDIVTRQLGHRLTARWGQPVVVENRPAAALTIGTGIAARATPDGYTLLMSDRSALAVAPHLYKTIPYDPVRDFTPITRAAITHTMLVAHPSLPGSSMSEFLAYAKAQPQPVQFATAGAGTNNHVAMEMLKLATGMNAIPVHYKGGGQSGLALVSGEVKVGFAAMAGILPHVNAGKVRALLVTSRQRFPGAADVPTAAEQGLPGLELEFWIGVLAPAGTPSVLVARLNREIGEVLRSPDMRSTLLSQGAEAAPGTPKEFADFISSESAKMRQLIEITAMRVE
jgi:tripartite-type tricarboxylate transporter receptor subunit TctC